MVPAAAPPVLAAAFSSTILLLLIAAAAALVRHHASWRRGGAGGRHPPGSVGPLPLVGETLRLVGAYKTENPETFIDDRVRRHGSRIFTSHVFGERTVFSADPEFNRAVLAEEGRSFRSSYPSSIATLLGPHSLLLTPVGPRHKRMHALILARFASPAALRDSPCLLRDIDRLVRLNLRGWITSSDDGDGDGDGDGMVRLLEQAKKITFELTVKQLMSQDPGEWTEGLRHHYLLLIEGFFSIPFPFPSLLPFTAYARALRAREEVAAALRTMVKRRRSDQAGRGGTRDMLDELLEAEDEGLSPEEIVDFLVSLLVAGYETTSTIMTLAVKYLTDTPPALAALRAEHEEILSRKKHESEPLDWVDYKSMPFTQCVINETLRVANIISGVFRRAATDIHFRGYTIPKGSKVFASFRAVHLDPDYYKDARTFNPWRWQQEDAPQQTGGAGGIFTPFGGGPRLCPGYELARVEISIFLHYLVTRFSWEAAEEDRLLFFPTTRTLKGYPINVRRRRAL